MALEGLEEVTEEGVEAPEVNPAEITNEVTEIGTDFDQINEADGINQAVDSFKDTMQEKVDSGEGMSQTEIQVVQTALEHFYKRLGYKPNKNKTILALEHFNDKESQLKNTKLAIEELNDFSNKLANAISITQESLIDKIASRTKSSSVQLEAILVSLSIASKDYDKLGKTPSVITGGTWSKVFGSFKSEPVKGKDVLDRLKSIDDIFSKANPSKIIQELCNAADDIARELTKEKGQVSNYSDLENKLTSFRKSVNDIKNIVKDNTRNSISNDEYEPLEANEKNTIVGIVKSISAELSAFSDNWEKLYQKIEHVREVADKVEESKNSNGPSGRTTKYRWLGALLGMFVFGVGAIVGFLIGLSADIILSDKASNTTSTKEGAYKNQAGQAKEDASSSLNSFIEIDAELVKICFAAVQYIEKSTA